LVNHSIGHLINSLNYQKRIFAHKKPNQQTINNSRNNDFTRSRIHGLSSDTGLINGNGLSDGNGLTLNLFSQNISNKSNSGNRNRVQLIAYRNKRNKIISAGLLILLILVPLYIYMIEFDNKDTKIQIDGEFNDWNGEDIIHFLDQDNNKISNPAANIVDCKLHVQDNILDFYIQSEWKLFGGSGTETWDNNEIYRLNIYIDSDLSSSTGYQLGSIGAEERIELIGQNGIISKAVSYNFDQQMSLLDWNGWMENNNIEVAKQKFRLEGRHYLINTKIDEIKYPECNFNKAIAYENIWLEDRSKYPQGIVFQILDSSGNLDQTEPILTKTDQWHQLQLIDISPNYIQHKSVPTPMIGLKILPYIKNNDIEIFDHKKLESITWTFENPEHTFTNQLSQKDGEFRLFADNNNNLILDEHDTQVKNCSIKITNDSHLTIDFSPPLILPIHELEQYLLTFQPNSESHYNKQKFLKMFIKPINVEASSTILIDIPKNSNYYITSYIDSVPAGIIIDGIFCDWDQIDDLTTDIDIPNVQNDNQNIRKVGLNINNNAGTLACYLDVYGNLLTGSNIPPIFHSKVINVDGGPVDSGNTKNDPSCLKIKPASQNTLNQLPEQMLGLDKISIFIDTDRNINSGYKPDWLPVGAEYVIQISGRNGEVYNKILMMYRLQSNSTWTWSEIDDIIAYKDRNQVELEVELQNLKIPLNDQIDIIFYYSDWSGNYVDFCKYNYKSCINESNFNNPSGLLKNKYESNSLPATSTRANIIDDNATSYDALLKSNQRKIVRDSNGYWYAFWIEAGGHLMAKRSNDTAGLNWLSNEIELSGSLGCVINNAANPAFYPTVDIYREGNISKNELHLAWSLINGSNVSICYSKCLDLTSIDNFSKANSWCKSDNTPGFEILEENVNIDILDNYGFPSIAVDHWNQPHVVWQFEYTNNSNYYFNINYTTWNNTNGWHNGAASSISITPWHDYVYKSPCIDISYSGIIHVAYANVSGSTRTIEYRQCWDASNSLSHTTWGDAAGNQGKSDIVLFNNTGCNMSEPSLICDAQGSGRVWVVSSEKDLNNKYSIWYAMDDFKDTNYWPNASKIINGCSNELKNPVIGYDSQGTIYCVWERWFTMADVQIYLSQNSSNFWTTPVKLTSVNKNIYPQIPKNLSGPGNQVSIIYKDDNGENIMFHSIPEFPYFSQFLILILIVLKISIIHSQREKFKEKSSPKTRKIRLRYHLSKKNCLNNEMEYTK
jgi:hypothetical protein